MHSNSHISILFALTYMGLLMVLSLFGFYSISESNTDFLDTLRIFSLINIFSKAKNLNPNELRGNVLIIV